MKTIAIIMGSDSDLPVMESACEILDQLKLPWSLNIISAHRTPDKMRDFALSAREQNIGVIIAGAGGSAHLPGMIASYTSLPVIGVPILSSNSLDGWDSLLSIVQMPKGIPVATVAVNGAQNAAILAAQILGSNNAKIAERLDQYKISLHNMVQEKSNKHQKSSSTLD